MDFIDKKLQEYIDNHTDVEPSILKQLARDTWAHVLQPRMLSGHYQGRVLSMLSRMIKPERILEIGTYTGYSALCLAEGLQQNGILHTVEVNEELHDRIRQVVDQSLYKKNITLHIGDALKIIPQLKMKFDLVFIDADKRNYSNYYNAVFEKVTVGGYLIADNVLWSGNVIKPVAKFDDETEHVIEFNNMVQNDKRVRNVLFPVRDGLMVIEKIFE